MLTIYVWVKTEAMEGDACNALYISTRLEGFLLGTFQDFFYRNDHAPIIITLNGIIIKTKTSMNVLGVQFDSKLTWHDQVNKAINKAKRTLHAINLIKKYFNAEELKGLLTSNFYSVLYYNSEIWNLPSLNNHQKQKLLSASANALKICLTTVPQNTSYEVIHRLTKRANPVQMSNYKHAIQLYKLHNSTIMTDDWVSLNFQQNFNGRNDKLQIFNVSNYKVGQNLLVNRLKQLTNKISFSWLNESFDSFKVKCKKLLLE